MEKDLEEITRYIEFSNDNMKTYSMELSHIILSACSEIDVILKQICELLTSQKKANIITKYQQIINDHFPNFFKEEIGISRYQIYFMPWSGWTIENSPIWWKSYNNIKHKRDKYYTEANLENAIYAMGALLKVNIYYYKLAFSIEAHEDFDFRSAVSELFPIPMFIRTRSDYLPQYITT